MTCAKSSFPNILTFPSPGGVVRIFAAPERRAPREVAPAIVWLLVEAAPIVPGSRSWLIFGYTPFKGLVEPALVPT